MSLAQICQKGWEPVGGTLLGMGGRLRARVVTSHSLLQLVLQGSHHGGVIAPVGYSWSPWRARRVGTAVVSALQRRREDQEL